jgi:hypothetical protein
MRRLVLTTLASIALLGCGDSGDEETGTGETRVPGPTDTLVVYSRSGGVAGVRERLAVRPDGAARVESGGRARRVDLGPAELDGLRVARDRVDFAKLDTRYGKEPPPPDTFAETVTADGRTVSLIEGGQPPPELQRLLSVCAGIVARYAPR